MNKKPFVVIFLILFSSYFFTDLCLGWTKTYGGSNSDGSQCVRQTSDGGYIITGWTISYGAGSYDIYLIKTDANGDTLWTKTYGGSGWDYSYEVQQTTDGGYIIIARTESFGAGNSDFWLLKTNSSGDTIWTKTYGGIDNENSGSGQQTSDGGYIIVGYTESYGAGDFDIWLVKTDVNGDTSWTKTYGGTQAESGHSVKQTNDGGYIIAGTTHSFGPGNSNIWLIKTDSLGDSTWSKIYGGNSTDFAYQVCQTNDGGYIVVGNTYSFGAGEYDIWLLKTDSNGDTTWTKTFGGDSIEYGFAVQPALPGGYIIAGYTRSYGSGGSDVWLIRTNSTGSINWDRTFGGVENDEGRSVYQTSDLGYIISGNTTSFGAGSMDILLLKTNITGQAVEETIISPSLNFNYRINQLPNRNINLQFSLPENSQVDLYIYDTAGRYITTPVSGNYSKGDHQINFRLDNSGVYFCNLIINGDIRNQKLIVF